MFPNCNTDIGLGNELEKLHTAGETLNGMVIMKNGIKAPQKIKSETSISSTNLPSEYLSRGLRSID